MWRDHRVNLQELQLYWVWRGHCRWTSVSSGNMARLRICRGGQERRLKGQEGRVGQRAEVSVSKLGPFRGRFAVQLVRDAGQS